MIPIVTNNVAREAAVMTDAASIYRGMNRQGYFASHDRVDHSEKEYARYGDGRPVIYTNTVEGYFSVFKRGMRGTYQHCKERHLHRYLSEFDFRYNRVALGVSDQERATRTLEGVKGKRLRTGSLIVPDSPDAQHEARKRHRAQFEMFPLSQLGKKFNPWTR